MTVRFDLDFDRGLQLRQATDFTLVDDATPLGLDDTTGSTGQATVSFARQSMRPADMKGLRGQAVTLSSAGTEKRGIGTVGAVSGSDTGVSISIDTVALRLAVKRTIKPFSGTLAAGIQAWCASCSIPASKVVVDASVASQQVALVGFEDNVWLRIKQLCAAVGIEVVVQDDTIVVRPPRAVVVGAERAAAKSWAVDDTAMAQSIQVAFYDPRTVVAGDLTPDYTRSNVSEDAADDPGGGLVAFDRTVNRLPAGYRKRQGFPTDESQPG